MLGYDYINVETPDFSFIETRHRATMETKEGERAYVQAADNLISNNNDFEAYPWPDMKTIDYSPFEKAYRICLRNDTPYDTLGFCFVKFEELKKFKI